MPTKKTTPKKKTAAKQRTSADIRKTFVDNLLKDNRNDEDFYEIMINLGYHKEASELCTLMENSAAEIFGKFMVDVLAVAKKHGITESILCQFENNDLYIYDSLVEGVQGK